MLKFFVFVDFLSRLFLIGCCIDQQNEVSFASLQVNHCAHTAANCHLVAPSRLKFLLLS